MFKTILIPIDIAHAKESKSVIDIAAANGSEDTRVILLNVVEEIPKWAAVELPQDIQEKSLQNSLEEMNAIAQAAEIKTEVDVRVGHPYQTILEVAKEKQVELIIIASHQPGLQDYLLGSTAAKVVRHAKCSVMVIR
ncbi:MAG: universal stress protein [Gammaproteobacteria bacterium]|nr:universal stress protein [Gammaproteobacteria bacterium]